MNHKSNYCLQRIGQSLYWAVLVQCSCKYLFKSFLLSGFTNFFCSCREVPLSKNEKALVLNKLCEGLLKLEPQELPTLSFQLFTLSTTPAQLMIPLISLNQYFQKYLYKKQLDQSPDSEPLNFDSIGEWINSTTTKFKHFSSHGTNQYDCIIFEQIDSRTMIWSPLKIQFYTIWATVQNIK